LSSDWYLIQNPMYVSGHESDEFSSTASGSFDELADSFLGRNVTLYGSTISSGITVRAIFQNITSDSEITSNKRQILLKAGTSSGKQYIKDNSRNEYWLINSLPSTNGWYDKVVAWYCNYTLKFISPKTGAVVSYPVYSTNATKYNTGEKDYIMLSIGSSQQLVFIPYNDETILMDHNKRLLIDRNTTNPTAYEITQVDSTSYAWGAGGLLAWTMQECAASSERDDKGNLIPDYYDENDVYELTISNADDNLTVARGSTYTLSCTATKNGMPLNQTSILFTSSNTAIATVSTAGKITGVANGSCTIVVKAGNVKQDIVVTVETASATASIKIFVDDDKIVYGQSKRVNFAAYQNGVETATTFTTLISSVTTLAEIASSGSGYVILRAVDNEALVGQEFTLTVSSAALSASAEQVFEIGGWF
jgi:hypothetical protein